MRTVALLDNMVWNPAFPAAWHTLPADALVQYVTPEDICPWNGKIIPQQIAKRDLPAGLRYFSSGCVLFATSADKFIAGHIGATGNVPKFSVCSRDLYVLAEKNKCLHARYVMQWARQFGIEQLIDCRNMGKQMRKRVPRHWLVNVTLDASNYWAQERQAVYLAHKVRQAVRGVQDTELLKQIGKQALQDGWRYVLSQKQKVTQNNWDVHQYFFKENNDARAE